jgi:uncharacterized cupin superfamily protein
MVRRQRGRCGVARRERAQRDLRLRARRALSAGREPGQLVTLYHEEDAEEDFLVLAGSCLLLIDERQRALDAWDFVHCAPGTPHAVVAGTERCVLLQVGARPTTSLRYPVSDLARSHGVGVDEETASVDAAYGERRRGPIEYGGWLAG